MVRYGWLKISISSLIGVGVMAKIPKMINRSDIAILAFVGTLSICPLTGILATAEARTKVKSWKSEGTTVTLSQDGTLVVKADTYFSMRGKMRDYCSSFCPYGNVPPWFDDISSITGLVIKKGVTRIGGGAFYACSSLTSTSVVIPNSVKIIGRESFFKCNMTSVTIGNGVKYIWNYAFADNRLTSVVIPRSVRAIGECAFCGNNLASIVIPAGATYIEDRAFSDVMDTITVAPDNPYYSSVNGVMFNKDKTILIQYPRNRKDTAYTVPKGVTSIGKYAFQERDNLTSVTINNDVKIIGEDAFSGSKLTSVTIGDSVKSIADGAFSNCDGLTSIIIPAGVEYIGIGAFSNCGNLTSVIIPAGVEYIGCNAFSDIMDTITVAPDNPYYSSVGGVLFNKKKTELIQYPRHRKDTAYTVPNGVTYIGDYAFQECDNLTSVTIPNSVTHIVLDAFDGSKLMSVTSLNPVPPFCVRYRIYDSKLIADATLYVPDSAVNAYKQDSVWNRFGKILPVKK
jgi:hypothetical protein